MHILSDANGLPLLVGISAGNTHDSEELKPTIEGHQTRHDPDRGQYFKPQRLHADKAYDRADLRKWLRGKHIGVRIARRGIESGERLGRCRWVVERLVAHKVRSAAQRFGWALKPRCPGSLRTISRVRCRTV